MGSEGILNFIDDICRYIREKNPNKEGLFRTSSFIVENEKWLDDRCDPDDLGDFAPFMVFYDIITGKKENVEWVKSQIRLMKEKLGQPSGLFYPFSDGRSFRRSRFHPIYPLSHMDTPLGLNLLYLLTEDKEYLEVNRALCEGICRYAISRKGFLYSATIPPLGLYYPRYGFLRHKPELAGTFIEEFSILYKNTGEKRFLDNAKKMIMAWVGAKSFKRFGVFPDAVYPYIAFPAVKHSRIYKQNLNMVSGMLEYYKSKDDDFVRESIFKSIDGFYRFRRDDGIFYSWLNIETGRIYNENISRIRNNAAMASLIDLYRFFGDGKYLEDAEICMAYWIDKQNEFGLFPEREIGQTLGKKDRWDFCEVDSHADTMVILAKLYFLTKKKVYKESLEMALWALNRFKTHNGGVVRYVNFNTGKMADKTNILKYLGGTIKGLWAAYAGLHHPELLDNELTWLVLRDR